MTDLVKLASGFLSLITRILLGKTPTGNEVLHSPKGEAFFKAQLQLSQRYIATLLSVDLGIGAGRKKRSSSPTMLLRDD